MKIDVKFVEVDEVENGTALFEALKVANKKETVPQIYISGTFVGGFDEFDKLHRSNELKDILLSNNIPHN